MARHYTNPSINLAVPVVTLAYLLGGAAAATDPPGRWTTGANSDMVAQLQAMGYLDGVTPAMERSGVTVHTDAAIDGLNLYTSGHAAEATLMDMDGRVLHRWQMDYADAFGPDARDNVNSTWWRRVHLLPDGSLLAIYDGLGLVKIDRDSELVWVHAQQDHHDLQVLDDGSIVVLTRKVREYDPDWMVDDHVTWLSAEGTMLREASVLTSVISSAPALASGVSLSPDVLHTNTVRVLDGSSSHPAFGAGNVLVSIRELSIIAVLNPDDERLTWALGGDFHRQHDSQMVAPDTLLLFDNGVESGRSRIVELDVRSGEESWVYDGGTDAPFFSETCGAVQRLDGGNTLVTVTDAGYAFEITRQGEIVWEFVSPHRAESNPALVATLQEVERIPRDFVQWLHE